LVKWLFYEGIVARPQYRAMAADREREREAADWVDSLAGETLE